MTIDQRETPFVIYYPNKRTYYKSRPGYHGMTGNPGLATGFTTKRDALKFLASLPYTGVIHKADRHSKPTRNGDIYRRHTCIAD